MTYELLAGSEAIDAGTATYFWKDQSVLDIPESDYSGETPDLGAVEYGSINRVIEDGKTIPSKIILYQNYPNPFNPRTRIDYELPAGGRTSSGSLTNYVELRIYSLTGQKVVTLVSEIQSAGIHQVSWDASSFSSGVYYCQIKTAEFIDTIKMVLMQ
jgi:hypothetical protein